MLFRSVDEIDRAQVPARIAQVNALQMPVWRGDLEALALQTEGAVGCEAAGELNKALAKIGKDPTVHDHLAEVYLKQGKVKEAIQQWEASIAEMKAAPASESDPEELGKITRKLDSAKLQAQGKK